MRDNPVGSGGFPGKYDYSVKTGLALYNLKDDPSESINVADNHPQVMKQIEAFAKGMRTELGDQLTDSQHSGQRSVGIVED